MMTDAALAIGKAIRTARKELGLEQRVLAEQIGAKQVTVSAWEMGRTVPTLKMLKKLIDELGLDEEEMMSQYDKQRKYARARKKERAAAPASATAQKKSEN